MSFGIDIYRYQVVADWHAVKQAGVDWVYVKLTDGDGPAPVRGDAQVHGAQNVGLPVGGYHFAQPGDPAHQADVLLGEITRLGGTQLPPMLDLEDNPPGTGRVNIPGSQKTGWAMAFLRHIADAGHRPCVYMSSADAAWLRPDAWDVPGLVIWIASYGANDGQQHPIRGYSGRVDIHQYTSAGRVAGISGSVDLNEALTNITEVDMTPEEHQWLQDIHGQTNVAYPTWQFGPDGDPRTLVDLVREVHRQACAGIDTQGRPVAIDAPDNELGHVLSMRAELAEVKAQIAAVGVTIDYDLLASKVATAVAVAVAEEIERRLAS